VRLSYVRKAYEKLDTDTNGKVTLDDVAKLYDVSHNPDVISGRRDPMDVYKHFMSMWDTQVADGVVTFEEF
jgi:hypothetical protein